MDGSGSRSVGKRWVVRCLPPAVSWSSRACTPPPGPLAILGGHFILLHHLSCECEVRGMNVIKFEALLKYYNHPRAITHTRIFFFIPLCFSPHCFVTTVRKCSASSSSSSSSSCLGSCCRSPGWVEQSSGDLQGLGEN